MLSYEKKNSFSCVKKKNPKNLFIIQVLRKKKLYNDEIQTTNIKKKLPQNLCDLRAKSLLSDSLYLKVQRTHQQMWLPFQITEIKLKINYRNKKNYIVSRTAVEY